MSATTKPYHPQNTLQVERMERILDASAVSLARELAKDMLPLEQILKNHGMEGVDDPRWVFLRQHPDFLNLFAKCVAEWNSADSTLKRVELKSQAALEELIPVLAVRAVDPGTSATAAAELAKVLHSLSGMKNSTQAGVTGPAFSITINMGSRQLVVRDTSEGDGEQQMIDHEPGTGGRSEE